MTSNAVILPDQAPELRSAEPTLHRGRLTTLPPAASPRAPAPGSNPRSCVSLRGCTTADLRPKSGHRLIPVQAAVPRSRRRPHRPARRTSSRTCRAAATASAPTPRPADRVGPVASVHRPGLPHRARPLYNRPQSGSSSVVEHLPSKQRVAGSIPVSRSRYDFLTRRVGPLRGSVADHDSSSVSVAFKTASAVQRRTSRISSSCSIPHTSFMMTTLSIPRVSDRAFRRRRQAASGSSPRKGARTSSSHRMRRPARTRGPLRRSVLPLVSQVSR